MINGMFTPMARYLGGVLGGPTGFTRAFVCLVAPCSLIGRVPPHH